ncbi:hypothetical protein ASZ90_011355 [hydrocarbon metagenome]|uniref:Uncharacterized protein n=1 Tax=hydrocarbon metagenome TaxID=938273 RepID=A0A0W8FDI5_9ZZZZ
MLAQRGPERRSCLRMAINPWNSDFCRDPGSEHVHRYPDTDDPERGSAAPYQPAIQDFYRANLARSAAR